MNVSLKERDIMKIPSILPSKSWVQMELPVIDSSGENKPKLASTIVDRHENLQRPKLLAGHSLRFAWDKDLEANIVEIIKNSSGEVVQKRISEAQRDHILRTRKLVGLQIDKQA